MRIFRAKVPGRVIAGLPRYLTPWSMADSDSAHCLWITQSGTYRAPGYAGFASAATSVLPSPSLVGARPMSSSSAGPSALNEPPDRAWEVALASGSCCDISFEAVL